jgi:hypothetical protein
LPQVTTLLRAPSGKHTRPHILEDRFIFNGVKASKGERDFNGKKAKEMKKETNIS